MSREGCGSLLLLTLELASNLGRRLEAVLPGLPQDAGFFGEGDWVSRAAFLGVDLRRTRRNRTDHRVRERWNCRSSRCTAPKRGQRSGTGIGRRLSGRGIPAARASPTGAFSSAERNCVAWVALASGTRGQRTKTQGALGVPAEGE